MPKFRREKRVFAGFESRRPDHTNPRNPIHQNLTFDVSEGFERLYRTSQFPHFAVFCSSIGSAFGHIFAPVVSRRPVLPLTLSPPSCIAGQRQLFHLYL